jgi:hypothetical protein
MLVSMMTGKKVPTNKAKLKRYRIPRLLYHGTTVGHFIEGISSEGLGPRGRRPSNDEYQGMPSMPDFVYLTNSSFVALEHACRVISRLHARYIFGEEGRWDYVMYDQPLVLQVETKRLDRKLFYPDEDWVAAEFMGQTESNSQYYKSTVLDLERYKKHWKASLLDHDRIAYKGTISPEDLSITSLDKVLPNMRGEEIVEILMTRYKPSREEAHKRLLESERPVMPTQTHLLTFSHEALAPAESLPVVPAR